MSVGSVLKAAQAAEATVSSIVLRSPPTVATPPVTEPGVWITHAELEALKTRCTEQGRAEGEEQGRRLALQAAQEQANQAAKAQLERELKERQDRHTREQAEKWRALATALAGQAQALRKELEAEVTEWTFVAVSRLIGHRTAADVEAAVRKVLAESQFDGPLSVLLHAHDLASLEACGAAAAENWPDGLKFASDERVGLGGCLIKSNVQTLDARLEVQLALLREALDRLSHERAGAEA